jgi:hypothetical protein
MKKLVALILLAGGLSAAPQVLDCLAAVVNNRSITLVDVRVAETFGIFDEEIRDRPGVRRRLILEKLIDQKVVLDLVREPAALDESELAAAVSEIVSRLGPEEFAAALQEFDFDRDDLAAYLGETLLFRRVLAARFEQGVTVSLREIEAHYQDVYLPAIREAGRDPEPFLQVLDDIEAEIKTTKKAVMIEEWIAHIRSQAEIRILPDCLDNEFLEKAP